MEVVEAQEFRNLLNSKKRLQDIVLACQVLKVEGFGNITPNDNRGVGFGFKTNSQGERK